MYKVRTKAGNVYSISQSEIDKYRKQAKYSMRAKEKRLIKEIFSLKHKETVSAIYSVLFER